MASNITLMASNITLDGQPLRSTSTFFNIFLAYLKTYAKNDVDFISQGWNINDDDELYPSLGASYQAINDNKIITFVQSMQPTLEYYKDVPKTIKSVRNITSIEERIELGLFSQIGLQNIIEIGMADITIELGSVSYAALMDENYQIFPREILGKFQTNDYVPTWLDILANQFVNGEFAAPENQIRTDVRSLLHIVPKD